MCREVKEVVEFWKEMTNIFLIDPAKNFVWSFVGDSPEPKKEEENGPDNRTLE